MTLYRLSIRPLALALVTTGLLACSRPESPMPEAPLATVTVARTAPEPAASAHAQQARSLLRLDYVLTTTDPGKAPTTAEYMVNVEENGPGEIHLGRNVPLQTRPVGEMPSSGASVARGPGPLPSASGRPPLMPSVPRQDVGLMLRCSYQASGDDFIVHSILELSEVVDESAPIARIAKVSIKGDAPVKAGQSIVVATSEDPNTHRRYQLAVKATRLR